MISLKRLAVLTAAALALAACSRPETAQAAPAGHSKPALWRLGDADTTVYLFGTVHVLPPNLDWETPAIDDALKSAKAVYFETDVEPDPMAVSTMVQRMGVYPPGDSLMDHLKPEEKAEIETASAKLKLPMAQIDTFKPWLAAMTMSEQTVSDAGYDPTSGVERKLLPLATSQGKEIRKLETVEEQLLTFADLPEKTQIIYLIAGVKEIDREKGLLGQLVGAWLKGDVAELDKVMIEDDLEEAPEVYQALLVKRNQNWTTKIDQLVKEENGTFFIAVGAGHLAGKDSVLKMLTKKGYKIERVE